MTGEHDDDLHLWELARRDQADAYGKLFDRHVTAVYNYCAHRVGSYNAAQDLTSTVFLEAWRCRARLPLTTVSLLPLLYGIAARVCARHHRSTRRFLTAVRRLPVDVEGGVDHAEAVADRVDAQQALLAVTSALRQLSTERREVAELCLIGGLDTRAAALYLKVPEGTVKSRLSRARAQLQHTLAGQRDINPKGVTRA